MRQVSIHISRCFASPTLNFVVKITFFLRYMYETFYENIIGNKLVGIEAGNYSTLFVRISDERKENIIMVMWVVKFKFPASRSCTQLTSAYSTPVLLSSQLTKSKQTSFFQNCMHRVC